MNTFGRRSNTWSARMNRVLDLHRPLGSTVARHCSVAPDILSLRTLVGGSNRITRIQRGLGEKAAKHSSDIYSSPDTQGTDKIASGGASSTRSSTPPDSPGFLSISAEFRSAPAMGELGALQSIVYHRGSLRLLDQRKLPLEVDYIDVKCSGDGWNAIRDMVVRGAPAIAIAAALALAVEVSGLEDFTATPAEAAAFVSEKLEYLVSSRPTAVNLSDAATKLRSLVSRTAETAKDAKAIFQAYIDAAETMLVDDVSDNKAIGSHGAEFLKQKLEVSKDISVLTHCNTGSLATAGYGTALGVIRALHSGGILEKAFCTETRPFNQGSRLTAFELVHDKVPATLIADSAAAALMKSGCIQAVIVGADRIAANGDTANKIGTYNLAISAKHHSVQFYVAAPITSIDLSLPSGEQIVIEERSPNELLNSEGGLGKQVAASGISVWNPAFDVTPANLITAIITEKGVITKSDADETFNIKDFIQSAKLCTSSMSAGLSGSSAIICAALSCLLDFYNVRHLIKVEIRPNIILDAEKELGIVAGLQDRVAQVYGGLVYMDFGKEHMDTLGHGVYTPLDINLLPPLHLIYADNPSDSGKVHSTVRQRWLDGEEFIISSMEEVARLALDGRKALLDKNYRELARLMNRNFDLRRQMFGDDVIGTVNIKMVEAARSVGAAAKFTGSGGAVVALCPDGEAQVLLLEKVCRDAGFLVQRIQVAPSPLPLTEGNPPF
uniref:Methylthioribose-1-phosphate isomerase n=1 Tax=Oryza barthii TaxID=65489 RepID=A0A0D3HJM8_9ORYZ